MDNSKPFWHYVKTRRQDNTGVAPLFKDDSIHSDRASKANILLQKCQSVFSKRDSSPLLELNGVPFPILDSLTITTEGVAKLLRNLNPAKASGPDNIPNLVMKTCADAITPSPAAIYNTSIETGQLPADWLSANVSPVFKKGDRNKADNYRPVSLTSVVCKLFEHIVCRRLHNHFDKHSIDKPKPRIQERPLRRNTSAHLHAGHPLIT